jgi:hypothetical protein
VTPARTTFGLARAARLVVLGIAFGWPAYVLASWAVLWNPADAGAYYDAAVRLTHGENLYAPMHPEAHEVYRYAPWFAVAWIPLTLLPRDLALHLWSLAMLACSIIAVWPLLRRGTPAALALGALLGAFLAETSMFGNAHPAIVAALVVAARSRWLPVVLGITASLKLVPIVFILPWVRARQWAKAGLALTVAAILWAPALLHDLSGYETDPGTGLLSFYAVSPYLWAVLAALAAIVAGWAVWTRSRWAWIALALLTFLGPPRVALSYLGFLAPAIVLTWAETERRTGG